jgi:hypothetical protein
MYFLIFFTLYVSSSPCMCLIIQMKTYYSFVIKFENKNLIIGLNRMEQLASIVLYDLGVPNFFIHKAPIFGEIDLGRQFFFFFEIHSCEQKALFECKHQIFADFYKTSLLIFESI